MTGEQIIKAREKLKLTREDLASKVGVTITTIIRWEKNKVIPHKVFQKKLIQILEGK